MNEKWRSWVTFGSVLMMIVGAFKFISGIIGLFNDQWLILGYKGYMLVDITGLAIWWLVIGAVLFLGGVAVLQGSRLGRAVGIVVASLAAISEFFMIPYYPIWSIIMLILYVVIIVAFVRWRGPAPDGSEELPVMEAAPTVVPGPETRSYVPPASDVPAAPEAMAAPAVAVAAVAAVAVAEEAPIEAAPIIEPAPAVAAAPVVEQASVVAAAPVVAAVAVVEETPAVAPAPIVEQPSAATPEATRIIDLMAIEGIGPAYVEKLEAAGLKTTDDLLQAGATAKGREDLATATGISGKLILRWVNMADLFRIKGVGEQYSDLLEAAGVDTVPELAQRRADNLTKKMAEVNEQKPLVRRLPTEDQVTGWIETAKGLPRVVTY